MCDVNKDTNQRPKEAEVFDLYDSLFDLLSDSQSYVLAWP